jgi:hypothetical protein
MTNSSCTHTWSPEVCSICCCCFDHGGYVAGPIVWCLKHGWVIDAETEEYIKVDVRTGEITEGKETHA